jgi:hypothetical protein
MLIANGLRLGLGVEEFGFNDLKNGIENNLLVGRRKNRETYYDIVMANPSNP